MVITKLEGGLGNQLFQYAAGRSVALRTKSQLAMDCTYFAKPHHRSYCLNSFCIKAIILPDLVARLLNGKMGDRRWRRTLKNLIAAKLDRLDDRGRGYDPRIERLFGHCRLSGAWQSEHYFAPIREQLLLELTPAKRILEPIQSIVNRVQAVNSVAVHVRRGDLVAKEFYRNRHGLLTASYYQNAIEQMAWEFPDAELFVFTEDLEWASVHIRSNRPITLVSGRLTGSAVEDLIVMSHCRHFIIANSTFSWWGAWLCTRPAKVVIAPAHFYRESVPWDEHIVPASWRRIETELSCMV